MCEWIQASLICSFAHSRRNDLIKEKIELKPIQLVSLLGIHYENKDFASFSIVVNSCCIDLLVCRGSDKQIRASVDTAREFSKEIPFTDSNSTTAHDGLCVQSPLYYDVFLMTNQLAISFARLRPFLLILDVY